MSFENSLLEKYASVLEGIGDGNYVGEDVRYSSAFEEVESALSSATSLFSTTGTDWHRIIELSEKILTSQSKDIRIVSWFSWALFKVDSFAGLHAGVYFLNELIVKCWDDIFPTKTRTRNSAINWLASRVEQRFQDTVDVQGQEPLFKALLHELIRLDAFLSEKWQENSPLLLPTCRRIERVIAETEQAIAKEIPEQGSKNGTVEKVVTQANESVTSGVVSQTAASSVDNERDASKLLRTVTDNSRVLCSWWLSQKSTDIRALRLNRTLLWIAIEALPPHDTNNVTTLRAVPIDKVNNYKERLGQGNYSDLIMDVEVSISKAPFWFDGQHIVWQCMQALRMDAAMLEIEIQLALLLQRIPTVIDLKFHDGIPFASEDTLVWINECVLPRIGTQSESINTHIIASSSNNEAWDEVLQECIDHLPKVGLKDSMAPLVSGLKVATGERERFFWQLCMAKLCFANKKYELAKTQLESLDEHIHHRGLEKWEPALVLDVVYLLYKCCELLQQSQQVRDTKEKLYKRLCFLDMDLIVDEGL